MRRPAASLSPEHRFLLDALKKYIHGQTIIRIPEQLDWDRVEAIAEHHGLFCLLHYFFSPDKCFRFQGGYCCGCPLSIMCPFLRPTYSILSMLLKFNSTGKTDTI